MQTVVSKERDEDTSVPWYESQPMDKKIIAVGDGFIIYESSHQLVESDLNCHPSRKKQRLKNTEVDGAHGNGTNNDNIGGSTNSSKWKANHGSHSNTSSSVDNGIHGNNNDDNKNAKVTQDKDEKTSNDCFALIKINVFPPPPVSKSLWTEFPAPPRDFPGFSILTSSNAPAWQAVNNPHSVNRISSIPTSTDGDIKPKKRERSSRCVIKQALEEDQEEECNSVVDSNEVNHNKNDSKDAEANETASNTSSNEDEDEEEDDDESSSKQFGPSNPWSLEEDMLLIIEHAKVGNRWLQIAKSIPSRTQIQCKVRFTSILRASKKAWTLENDILLLQLAEKHKWDFVKIAKVFRNRSRNSVKKRYRELRKQLRPGEIISPPNNGSPRQIFFQNRLLIEKYFSHTGAHDVSIAKGKYNIPEMESLSYVDSLQYLNIKLYPPIIDSLSNEVVNERIKENQKLFNEIQNSESTMSSKINSLQASSTHVQNVPKMPATKPRVFSSSISQQQQLLQMNQMSQSFAAPEQASLPFLSAAQPYQQFLYQSQNPSLGYVPRVNAQSQSVGYMNQYSHLLPNLPQMQYFHPGQIPPLNLFQANHFQNQSENPQERR